jgi:hypothetical protein
MVWPIFNKSRVTPSVNVFEARLLYCYSVTVFATQAEG